MRKRKLKISFHRIRGNKRITDGYTHHGVPQGRNFTVVHLF